MRRTIPDKVKLLLDAIRTSFWFVPGLMLAASFVLALGTTALDRRGAAVGWLRWIETTEGARAFLTTVATSMITVTGVVFSITIVALTLASSQFGPRLLRGYMRDRGNQVVLGTFVSTFLFCLTVLLFLRPGDAADSVPHVSISVAMVLTVGSLLILVFFIHHVSTSLLAESVVLGVVDELDEQLRTLRSRKREEDDSGASSVDRPTGLGDGCPVRSNRDGYVLGLGVEALGKWAERHDSLVVMSRAVGEFVVSGDELLRILSSKPSERRDPDTQGAADGELSEDDQDGLRAEISLGSRRTPERDPLFLFEQLVELALRALSPGINDPITAVSCIHRLEAALCSLAESGLPRGVHCDADGRPRVVLREPAFADFVDASLDPLREPGAAHPMVLLAMVDLVEGVARRADGSSRRVLEDHLEALRRTAEREQQEPRDRRRLEAAIDRVLEDRSS